MSEWGLPVREDVRQVRIADLKMRLEEVEAKGRELGIANLRSTRQIVAALGDDVRLRRTPKGNPRLDGRALGRLLDRIDTLPPRAALILRLVQDERNLRKELEMYESLEPRPDGRAPVQWKVHGTAGSRWSSTPNRQNLPREARAVIGAP
jgi:hypothetical protein